MIGLALIGVETDKQDEVVLRDTGKTQAAFDHATAIPYGVKYVTSVNNQIKLLPTSSKTMIAELFDGRISRRWK